MTTIDISEHYSLTRLDFGYLVVDKECDEPIMDSNGNHKIFYRIRDAQRFVEKFEGERIAWETSTPYPFSPPPDPGLPEADQRDWKGFRNMLPIIKLCATVLCVAGTVKIMQLLF